MRWCLFLLIGWIAVFAADDPYAAQLFQKNCASCHNSEAGAGGRIPQLSALKSMTPAAIQRTLESGVMKQQAAPLSADERQRLAGFLGTAITLERAREQIADLCPAGAAPGGSPAWAGWGGGLANMRFQSAKDAGLRAEDLPKLKLKWAFAFPDTSTMRSQPAGRTAASTLSTCRPVVCTGPPLCRPRCDRASRWERPAGNPRCSSAIPPGLSMHWTPRPGSSYGRRGRTSTRHPP